jgi:PAS domain S-box-containing protein
VTLESRRRLSPAKDKWLSSYLEAALDCVVMADASGCVVEFNPAAERTFGYSREEALGRTLAELIVPPSLRERHQRAFERFVGGREPRLFGQRLELIGMRADGSQFPVELALSQVEGEPLLICGALRDLSDAKRREDDLRTLADEQAALRRVATLVAREPAPAEVFAAVAEEAANLLHSPRVNMVRYELDGTATVIAGLDEQPFPLGSNWTLDGPSVVASVLETRLPARVDDYAEVPGMIADQVRNTGIHSAVGVPIVVDGSTWGAMVAVAPGMQPLPQGTESRLANFTELVAAAIANTQARENLRLLADEQAALQKVATLVAKGAAPDEVFAAVAEQVAHLLDVPAISMVRFEADGSSIAIAVWGNENPFEASTRFEPYPGVMSQIRHTGQPARLEEYGHSTGPTTARLRAAGIQSGVGVPIVVDGEVWGATIALATAEASLPSGIEARLKSFTDLVAIAISNLQARDDLRGLAEEQAALRRVATLVARGADSHAVFHAVCEETGRLLGASSVNLAHFTSDGFSTTMAGWSLREIHVPTGTRIPLDGHSITALIQRTAAPGRSGLTATEDRFRELVEQLPLVTYVRGLDVYESNAYVSPQVEAMLGYSVEEWESDPALLERVVHPDDRDYVFAEAMRARETADPFRLEYRMLARDGRLIWVYDEMHLVHDADGRPRGVQGILLDISERKEAEAAASESEKRFRAMVANLPGASIRCAHDPDWTMEFVSDAIEEISGYPASDFIGSRVRSFASVIHPDDKETLPKAIENGKRYEVEYRVMRPDGSVRWVLESGIGQSRPDGAPRLDGAIFDITERRRAQDALAESKRRFGSIIETTNEWIWAEDERGGLTYTNPAVYEMLGYTYEGVGGELAVLLRRRGIRSEVGAPVIVEGRVWGALIAGTDEPEPLPLGTELRLARFTELVATAISRIQARDELRDLADEQAALRRVATLVARGTDSRAVFEAVCAETGRLIGASSVNLAHFTADGFNLTMAGWSLRDTHIPTDTRLPLGPDTINGVIQQTVAPARIESYEGASGELAALLQQRGIRSEVGAPVIVEGRVWGALIAGTDSVEELPAGAEQRVASFAELIATAVANVAARSELVASRARIVAAGDEARRLVERNLHDGAQQRLIAIGLDLETLKASTFSANAGAHQELDRIKSELDSILGEIREISHGLHPTLLSEAGLGPALRSLARRSPVPVELQVQVEERLPASIETAAYYVVSEALANAAKHANASAVTVIIEISEDRLLAAVGDDGVGGADTRRGSGLVGLIDRVEALGGHLSLESAPGRGTLVAVELPLATHAAQASLDTQLARVHGAGD